MPDVTAPAFPDLQSAIVALKAGIQKHNLGVYEVGIAYNFIVAHKSWEGSGYANASDLLNREAQPAMSPATASKCGHVVTAFPRETCLKYEPTLLYELIQYGRYAHLGALPADPGELLIPVQTKDGVVQKPFKSVTSRELQAATHAAEAGTLPDNVQSELQTNDAFLATLPGHKSAHTLAQGHGTSLNYSIVNLTPEELAALRTRAQRP